MLPILFQATALGLTHSLMARYMQVWQPCDTVWFPEAGHFLDPCILLVLLLVKEDCWSACRYHLVPPNACAPDNPPPHLPPVHSCLVTHLIPHTLHSLPVCVSPSFQNMSSRTRNKSTSLDLWCCTTLEVGVVFSQTFPEFLGWYDWCVVFLSHPPPYPKFPVWSNGWKPESIYPAHSLPCLLSVRRYLCIYRCILRHCNQTTPGWNVCQHQLVVPWFRHPQWCAPPLHKETVRFTSKCFESTSGFWHQKIESAPPTT